ncbi:MAG: hypothetical protein ACI9JE_001661 [Candidatus Krumholzibacteriia bacterium]|jgi:hypothetical protein
MTIPKLAIIVFLAHLLRYGLLSGAVSFSLRSLRMNTTALLLWVWAGACRKPLLTQRNRLPLSSLFFSNSDFEAPLDVTANPFDSFGRC